MTFLEPLGRRLLDVLLPRACLACGRALASALAPLGLCPVCHGQLAPLDPRRRCRHCLRPLPPATAGLPVCLDCVARPPELDRLAAAWVYREPLRSVLRALKFRRLDFLAGPLAREALSREPFASFDAIDCVVPVPLAPWRRLGRGFNQAERLAAPIARHLGSPQLDVLARNAFASRRQSGLGRAARQRNLDHGIRVRRSSPAAALEGRSVLLVDDIVTTGSTLAAAARVVRQAGARRVAAFAVAATPRAAFGEAAGRA